MCNVTFDKQEHFLVGPLYTSWIKDNSSIKTHATLSCKCWGFLYFPVQQIIVQSLEKKSLASFKHHFFLKKVMIGKIKSLGIKLI